MQRQRHTLLSLAVCAALGGALPAVYAQTQDRSSDTRSDQSTQDRQSNARPEAQQGTERDRFLWDRNEYRDRQDIASNRQDTRHASWRNGDHDNGWHNGWSGNDNGLHNGWRDHDHDKWRDHDGWRKHGDFRGDFRDIRNNAEIRGDFREIREDRAELQRDLAERAANRDQLKVALGTNDRDGIAWERGQIRENNREIRQDRRELRGDFRELRSDFRDVRNDRHDFDRHDGDHRFGEHHGDHRFGDRDRHREVRHVDFRHDSHDRRDFGHDRGERHGFDRNSHDRRDFGHDRGHNGRSTEFTHKDDTRVKADAKVASK